MRYETFDPQKHDLTQVAKLVYDVDFRTFDMLFKTPESAVRCIAKDLPKRGLGDYFKVLLDDDGKIIGGLGVIENDFHDRKDLSPNVCAVYTEEAYRGNGIAGHLLNMVVEDLKSKGITPLYLITDHTGFYEQYGWEFLCMVQGDGEEKMTRMYIYR